MSEGFFRAIRNGHLRQVVCLVRSRVSPRRARDSSTGQCAVVVALHIEDPQKRLRMFRYLYRHGGDSWSLDHQTCRDVFTWCCYLDRTAEALFVMEDQAGELDLQRKDNTGRTGLHYAAVSGNATLLQAMLDYMQKYGLDVDIRDSDGFTPYLLAHRVGHKQCAEILARAGASPSQLDHKNFKSVEDWVWIGEREKSFFAKESQRSVVGMYKVLGRLPALHAAKFKPQHINIVQSKLDRYVLKQIENPGLNKSCELFKQQTWLDFEQLKTKRLSKSLPDFHLPPLAEYDEERRHSVSTSVASPSLHSDSPTSHASSFPAHRSRHVSPNADHSSRMHSMKTKPSLATSTYHRIPNKHQSPISANRHQETAISANQHQIAIPANQHQAAAVSTNQYQAAILRSQYQGTTNHNSAPTDSDSPSHHQTTHESINSLIHSHSDNNLSDIMKALEEQCTGAYRPRAKKKVVIPVIAVEPPVEKSRKSNGNKLKKHVLAKQMASKLIDKKDRRARKDKTVKSSKVSKISTISEEH